jgi:ATP-dependent Clp protease ATP-binding subunit ClpA
MPPPDGCVPDIFTAAGRLQPDGFTDATHRALDASVRFAQETCWDMVRSPHLFMGLLAEPDAGVREWGDRLGADLPRLVEQFRELFQQTEGPAEVEPGLHREFFSDNVLRLLREAQQRAVDHHRRRVTPMDLLITLFTAPNSIVAECFERTGTTAAKLTEVAVMAELAPRRG